MQPYELPKLIKQIPAPAVNVPEEIQIALEKDGPEVVASRLIYAEHHKEGAQFVALQQKCNTTRGRVQFAIKGVKFTGGSLKRTAKYKK